MNIIKGVNKDFIVNIVIDNDNNELRFMLSSKRYIRKDILIRLFIRLISSKKFLDCDYLVNRDVTMKYFNHTLIIEFDMVRDLILNLIKKSSIKKINSYSQFLFKSDILEREFTNENVLDFKRNLPPLVLHFINSNSEETKVKIYDYQFELDKIFYKKGGF